MFLEPVIVLLQSTRGLEQAIRELLGASEGVYEGPDTGCLDDAATYRC